MSDSKDLPPDGNPPHIPDDSFIPDTPETLFLSDDVLDHEPQSREFIVATYGAANKGLVSETFLSEQEVLSPDERHPLYELLGDIGYAHSLCKAVVTEPSEDDIFDDFILGGTATAHRNDVREFRNFLPEVIASIYRYDDETAHEKLLELLHEGLSLEALPEYLRAEVEAAFQNPDIAVEIGRLSAEANAATEALKVELGRFVAKILRDRSGDHDDIEMQADALVNLAIIKWMASVQGIPLRDNFEDIVALGLPKTSDLRAQYSSGFIDGLLYVINNNITRIEQRGSDEQLS